jgi:tetratricopeptide (TPR) repeat protein
MSGTSGIAGPGAEQRITIAARQFDLAPDAPQKIAAGLELSELQTAAGRYGPALEILDRIQSLAADDGTHALILRNIGRVYMRQSKFDEAALCLGEAIVKLSERSGSIEQFHIYRDLAWIYYRQGFLAQARNYSEGAQLILRNIEGGGAGCDVAWELLWHVLALIEAAAGNHELAVSYLEQERASLERSGDTGKLGALYSKLSSVRQARGELVPALALQQKALELSQHSGDLLHTAVSHKNLSEIYFCMGDLEQSRAHNDRFLELNPAINNTIGIAFGLAMAARIRCEQDDFESAEALYKNALTVARAIRSKGKEASVLLELTGLFCDRRRLQPAEDFFRQSCQICAEINQFGGQHQLVVKSQILALRSESAPTPDQRIVWLEEAARMLETALSKPIAIDDEEIISAPELEIRALALWAGINRTLKNAAQAGELLRRAGIILDRLAAQFDPSVRVQFLARRPFRELAAMERSIGK